VLLARKERFFKDGRWHTWIDYDKFQELVKSGQPFTSADYSAPTPEWALFGAPEQGFSPAETRFNKKERK
jgi:tRNA wybutosine-synthesizing protein 1